MPTHTAQGGSGEKITIVGVRGDEVTVPFPAEQDHATLIVTQGAVNRALTELDGLGMAGICMALAGEFREIWADFLARIGGLGESVSEDRFGATVHGLQQEQSDMARRALAGINAAADALEAAGKELRDVAEQSDGIARATAAAKGDGPESLHAADGPTEGGGFGNGLGTV